VTAVEPYVFASSAAKPPPKEWPVNQIDEAGYNA